MLNFSMLYADYCFKDKGSNEIICYKKYFQRENIYKSKSDENYYLSENGNIYAISDKIEIKFNTIGAIISLEKDFEIDFVDKLRNETYIFKARNPYELFSILSNLNRLDAIQKAVPQTTKKYTQIEVQRRIEQRKARLEKVMEKSKNRNSGKDAKDVGFQTGFTNIKEEEKGGKNFLKGEH
jgi:hypothetical protein